MNESEKEYLMFKVFEGATADVAYQQIRAAFKSGGFDGGRESRGGKISEILHSTIAISEPRQRWVASRQPALNVAFALAEIIWIVRGRNDSAFLNYFNRELPKYAGKGDRYHGAYGHRLRFAFGIDQLERAYTSLRNNPESRQIVLQMWNPVLDFPDDRGNPASPDIPCNVAAFLKVRDGKLEWMQIMRSNDVYRGLPYNIVQFTTLQEVIAGWLDLDLGQYHHLSDSLHVYENTANEILASDPILIERNTDNLAITKADSDAAFLLLEFLVESLITEDVPVEKIIELAIKENLSESFLNIARILCAESARRRGQLDLANRLFIECTNAAYRQLFDNWMRRVSRAKNNPSV